MPLDPWESRALELRVGNTNTIENTIIEPQNNFGWNLRSSIAMINPAINLPWSPSSHVLKGHIHTFLITSSDGDSTNSMGKWYLVDIKPIWRLPAGLYLEQWFQLIVNDHKFFKCHKIKNLLSIPVRRLTALHKNIHIIHQVKGRQMLAGAMSSSSSGVYSWKKNLILLT